MLSKEDLSKVEKHIDSVLNEIRQSVSTIPTGVSERKRLDEIVKITVNKVTPESKMILTGVCKQLTRATLGKTLYSDPKIKAAFYQEDIAKKINDSFDFTVPDQIDFDEIDIEVKKLIGCGAIVIGASGVVSIFTKNWGPVIATTAVVGVAAVIVAICLYIYKNKKKSEADVLADQYFSSIKASLMSWINSIEEYYDKKVSEFERQYS
jgi:hypothetical protein